MMGGNAVGLRRVLLFFLLIFFKLREIDAWLNASGKRERERMTSEKKNLKKMLNWAGGIASDSRKQNLHIETEGIDEGFVGGEVRLCSSNLRVYFLWVGGVKVIW